MYNLPLPAPFDFGFASMTVFDTGFIGQRYWLVEFHDYTGVLVVEGIDENTVIEPSYGYIDGQWDDTEEERKPI